ncbi:MAG: SMC-Scp complex subunit ScpB [Gammaproteobacteria bacterium]|nr:SMC-Scp complex subunit ScpB [Gammaproteobacteria bacterium]
MSEKSLKYILEGALLAAGRPLSIDQMLALFLDSEQPGRDDIRVALDELIEDYKDRSIELKQVASGYRVQVKEDYSEWVSRLWSERPSRYSRALLETLSLMAYRQPITRGEIEDIRGVSVSSSIVKTLQEREWIKVVGYRDVPGKPAMYATTKIFLDYFGLKSLDDLPTLAELRDIDSINAELDFEIPAVPAAENNQENEQTTEETNNELTQEVTPEKMDINGEDDVPAEAEA